MFWTAFATCRRRCSHLILPGVTVGFFSLSRNARLVRSSMLEVLGQDFVRTARAKGLPKDVVVVRHALRNAWLPVVTMVGLEFGFLLCGVVVVETIFAWPGVGRLVFNAINQRDIPLVQAAIVLSRCVRAAEPVVDILYARLDPRVRLCVNRMTPTRRDVAQPECRRAQRWRGRGRSLLRAKWPASRS